jgi:hypothetical protein
MSESSRSYVVKSREELITALGIFVIASPHNIIALASLLTKTFELYWFFIHVFSSRSIRYLCSCIVSLKVFYLICSNGKRHSVDGIHLRTSSYFGYKVPEHSLPSLGTLTKKITNHSLGFAFEVKE